MCLAWRNLPKDKARFLLSVGGVALAILLILILGGFVSGLNVQVIARSSSLRPGPRWRAAAWSPVWE